MMPSIVNRAGSCENSGAVSNAYSSGSRAVSRRNKQRAVNGEQILLCTARSQSHSIARAEIILASSAHETSESLVFDRGVRPALEIVLPEKADALIGFRADPELQARIEELARESTEGELS